MIARGHNGSGKGQRAKGKAMAAGGGVARRRRWRRGKLLFVPGLTLKTGWQYMSRNGS